jgi:hypothetical protein
MYIGLSYRIHTWYGTIVSWQRAVDSWRVYSDCELEGGQMFPLWRMLIFIHSAASDHMLPLRQLSVLFRYNEVVLWTVSCSL